MEKLTKLFLELSHEKKYVPCDRDYPNFFFWAFLLKMDEFFKSLVVSLIPSLNNNEEELTSFIASMKRKFFSDADFETWIEIVSEDEIKSFILRRFYGRSVALSS